MAHTRTTLPKVSIIIATHNNEGTIDECLKSVLDLNYPKELLEVIIADGCSKDSTVKIAEKYPVKIISKPLNAPAAYNDALKIVQNAVVGFLDSDAKVEKEWLNKLVHHLDDPKVAGVAGAIEIWNNQSLLSRCVGYDIKHRYVRLKKYAKRVATMNLLLKKAVIEEVRGFDEKLSTQYDTDLGVRITSEGYKIVFEPEAKCYHFNRPTLRQYFKQQLHYGMNTVKLYLKHSRLIKGDEITDFWMNIQPALFLIAILFFLFWLPVQSRFLLYAFALTMAFILICYIYSAAKLSFEFKDATAMFLVIVYFVRAFAWLIGAAITMVSFLVGEKGE